MMQLTGLFGQMVLRAGHAFLVLASARIRINKKKRQNVFVCVSLTKCIQYVCVCVLDSGEALPPAFVRSRKT